MSVVQTSERYGTCCDCGAGPVPHLFCAACEQLLMAGAPDGWPTTLVEFDAEFALVDEPF